MLEGGASRSRGNMFLWIAAAILSVLGLGANVYKYNTGAQAEFDWLLTISEVVILLAAGFFIRDYFRRKREEREKRE